MYKVVVRLLGREGEMLGWKEIQAHARGDGKLWSLREEQVPVTKNGVWTYTSAHWADLNIEVQTVVPEDGVTVNVGSLIPLTAPWPIFKLGEPAGGLEPVTVGSVSITVPTGSINSAGN